MERKNLALAVSVHGEEVKCDHEITLIAGENIYAPCFVYIGKDGKAYMARPDQAPDL